MRISFRRTGNAREPLDTGGATWSNTKQLVNALADAFDPGCDLDGGQAVCGWTDTRTGDPIPNVRNSLNGGQNWTPRQELD